MKAVNAFSAKFLGVQSYLSLIKTISDMVQILIRSLTAPETVA